MNILSIDTSGPVAGCAVMRDGKISQMIAMNQGLTHSETIMPAVDYAQFVWLVKPFFAFFSFFSLFCFFTLILCALRRFYAPH